VLHTAEGAGSYQSLGSFFSDPTSGVSSHAGIDDTLNTIGVYVRRADKAWTAANANPYAVQAELCGFASWTPDDWWAHPIMLENTAKWIAEESAAFGIPITRLSPSAAQNGGWGVCQHVDLGSWGGNHWDCGPNFPMDQVIALAQGIDTPTPAQRGRKMIAKTDTQNGYWTTTSDGAVYAFGDAIYEGGANTPDLTQPGVEIIGIEGHGRDGYWLLASDGSIFAFGSAPFLGRPDRT
jgi:hypothetical protein